MESQQDMSGQERQTADIAAIKARVESVMGAIKCGEPIISLPSVYHATQLGLRPVYADEWGRMWRDDGNKLTRIYSPRPKWLGVMTADQAADITKRST